MKGLYYSFAMVWIAGCSTPADPPAAASGTTIPAQIKTVEAEPVPTSQTARLIPPGKPAAAKKSATTAAISNELIVDDTVVNQAAEQPIHVDQIDTDQVNADIPALAAPALAAAVPDTQVQQDPAGVLAADKLEQLYTLALSGDGDAQLTLGDVYATGVASEDDIADTASRSFDGASAAIEAHHWYQLAAGQGNHIAQYKLGLQYYRGDGVERDYTMAREWWLESATRGNADAQQRLGYLYSEALGVERDYNRAISWYTRAAHLGHAEAQTLLGSLYHEGNRVPQNYAEAFKWYKMAAERGHPHSQYTLATLYHDGYGTEQDFVKCVTWVDIALSNGYFDEFNARDECAKHLDDLDLEKATTQADKWKSSYANKPGFN